MKNTVRIISLLLALLFSTLAFASAESFDLSGLSYDELITLRQRIDLAIMQSDGWKEVTVPVGTYVIGRDIPAGDYTVTYEGRMQACLSISVGGIVWGFHILNPSLYKTNSIGKLSLSDGQILDITYGEVIFTPYKGLGF